MLKIKDNIDLKQLEKFGLKPRYDCNPITGEVYINCIVSERYAGKYGHLSLRPKKKGLHLYKRKISDNNEHVSFYHFSDNTYVDIDLLYDLIRAGLVEKVGDK